MSRAPGSQGGFVKTFLAKQDGNHAKNKYLEKKKARISLCAA